MKRFLTPLPFLAGVALLTLLLPPQAVRLTAYGTSTTTRVSVASDATQGNREATQPAISADGRYVVFASPATNLVAGGNNAGNIFVHDVQTGQTSVVSVASDGSQANGYNESPAISADGRYVAFVSEATNLVPGDTNGARDIFVHDMPTGRITRVSVASDGIQANDRSDYPVISADGRYVAFASDATNLVPGDTNGARDIFMHDMQTGQTTRVSVASDGTQANVPFLGFGSGSPAISADGRYVAFASEATNLVPGDTNGSYDVFVHDRQTGWTTRVSVASDGTQANVAFLGFGSGSPAISADGHYVAFVSDDTNLVPGDTNGALDAFVHDRQTGRTTRVSVSSDGTQANGFSESPAISADGRYVAFVSHATNLVPGDTNDAYDVFVHDMQTGWITRASVASDGTQAIHQRRFGGSASPSISNNGRYVAFVSDASNLVADDTNGRMDIFVRDRGSGPLAALYLPLVIQGAAAGW